MLQSPSDLPALAGHEFAPTPWESFSRDTLRCFAAVLAPGPGELPESVLGQCYLIARCGPLLRLAFAFARPVTGVNYGLDQVRHERCPRPDEPYRARLLIRRAAALPPWAGAQGVEVVTRILYEDAGARRLSSLDVVSRYYDRGSGGGGPVL